MCVIFADCLHMAEFHDDRSELLHRVMQMKYLIK